MTIHPPVAVLGIDAGGTSLRVAVADAPSGGAIRGQSEGAAAPDGGPETLAPVVQSVLGAARLPSRSVLVVFAGITKISRAGVQAAWEAELARLFPHANVYVVPDFVIAFHGAIKNGVGISAVAGTGSVVYGENQAGKTVRVGGRGWEWGDEGSGGWMTSEVLRRTLRALDKREPETAVTQAVCRRLQTFDAAHIGDAARQEIATNGRGFLVPLLLEQAQNGDKEATNLFVGAGGWLAAQVQAAHAQLGFAPDEVVPVATVGGLWEAGELLRVPFITALHRPVPHAVVRSPDATPVKGAVRLARREHGLLSQH